jgi:hypothetical protein
VIPAPGTPSTAVPSIAGRRCAANHGPRTLGTILEFGREAGGTGEVSITKPAALAHLKSPARCPCNLLVEGRARVSSPRRSAWPPPTGGLGTDPPYPSRERRQLRQARSRDAVAKTSFLRSRH